jgi:hypothetical protein
MKPALQVLLHHETRPAGTTAPHVIMLTKCRQRLSHLKFSDVLGVQAIQLDTAHFAVWHYRRDATFIC